MRNRSRVRRFRGSEVQPITHNGEGMRIDRFEAIEAWQLDRELARKVKEKKATLNGEP